MENSMFESIEDATGKPVKQIEFYLVIVNGEIEGSYEDYDEACGVVDMIEQENTDDAIEDSGRDADDLTFEEYGEMQIKGAYDGDYAYVETIHITKDVDLEDEYETEEGDTFLYSEIRDAYLERK